MDLRDFPAILPLHFFEVELEVNKGVKPAKLKGYSEFLDEDSFCEVSLAWTEGGIHIGLSVLKPFEKAFFPEVEKGDGMEIFIDTRGISDALIIHKYCHHFVFLPKEVDGIIGVEVTRFRTNDKRELSRKESLKVATQFTKNEYSMQIFIPDEALFGFDPIECSLLKMAYIVHRGSDEPNYFPKSGNDYNLKDHPSLWAALLLK